MIDISQSGHYVGDCRELLKRLPDACVQTCVTSPPYWGLRDYGVDGQLGLEQSPAEYVANMVGVFREVRRVLRDDGTLWLNLGDSYASPPSGKCNGDNMRASTLGGGKSTGRRAHDDTSRISRVTSGLKPKDLVGIPWMVAFALRAAGWYLRADIIWAKPNPMPESVTDRPTKAHEYVFLLAKSQRYHFDHEAIAEPAVFGDHKRNGTPNGEVSAPGQPRQSGISKRRTEGAPAYERAVRNKRSVWTVATQPYEDAHFACFPPALIEPCILAGSRPGDIVLDPFFGSGTTGMVAEKHGRRWIGFDLNPEYEKLQRERTAQRSLVLGSKS